MNRGKGMLGAELMNFMSLPSRLNDIFEFMMIYHQEAVNIL